MFANTTQMTFDLQYRFNLVHSFKVVVVIEVMFLILGAAAGSIMRTVDKSVGIAVWIIIVVVMIIYPFTYRPMLRKSLKKLLAKSPNQDENVIVSFIFNEENIVIEEKRFDQFMSLNNTNYANLIKIIQHKNILFIYVGINQAFILDGDNMTKGSFSELTDFLITKLGKKYKVRRSRR